MVSPLGTVLHMLHLLLPLLLATNLERLFSFSSALLLTTRYLLLTTRSNLLLFFSSSSALIFRRSKGTTPSMWNLVRG